MISLILDLLRTLAQPDGSSGELLSTRRKYHLLQAQWYARLAAEGEAERKCTTTRSVPRPDAAVHSR